jgi:thioredoxin-dependent peroxiredoxin
MFPAAGSRILDIPRTIPSGLPMTDLLKPGTDAPDFEGTNQDGIPVRLRDFRGKSVVLYFYPHDDTFGCTREACAFRDDIEAFREVGAVVLGVSTQDEAAHRKFREKYGLRFDLIADPGRTISTAYRAVAIHGLAKRVTYVVGPDGGILAAYRRVDPKSHSKEALRILMRARGMR